MGLKQHTTEIVYYATSFKNDTSFMLRTTQA